MKRNLDRFPCRFHIQLTGMRQLRRSNGLAPLKMKSIPPSRLFDIPKLEFQTDPHEQQPAGNPSNSSPLSGSKNQIHLARGESAFGHRSGTALRRFHWALNRAVKRNLQALSHRLHVWFELTDRSRNLENANLAFQVPDTVVGAAPAPIDPQLPRVERPMDRMVRGIATNTTGF